MTDDDEYRKPNTRYEWQSEFDQQKAEARIAIAELYDKYSYEPVMAAMLDLTNNELSNRLREEYGREYGDEYLPPNPQHGIVEDESTIDEVSNDDSVDNV